MEALNSSLVRGSIVADVAGISTTAPAWASIDPGLQNITLAGELDNTQIRTFLIALAQYNEVADYSDWHSLIGKLSEAEKLLLPGGLRINNSEVTIESGCCCGVEEWRDQLTALEGCSPWWGHDPAPWAELDENDVVIWSDGRDRKSVV